MKSFKLYIILSLSIAMLQNANSKEQVSHGNESQNIQANGNVNTNMGDKIASIRINNTNIHKKIRVSVEKNLSKKTIYNIKHLIINNKLGFSEIFHNRKTNNFYIKNHKYNTVSRLSLSKAETNYINNSKTNNTNIKNNNRINIYNSRTRNTINQKKGSSLVGNVHNGDKVNEKRVINIENSTFINNESYYYREGDKIIDLGILKFNY